MQMREDNFVKRECCPVCRSTLKQELYTAGFGTPPISTYLHEFYSPQGSIELNLLEDGQYVLDECKECGHISQRFILNDFMMLKLYEEWINPQKVFDSSVRKHGVEYYSRLSKKIEMVINHFGKRPNELDLFDFGMGWGEWCRMAKAYGCSVSGAEISESRMNYVKASNISIINWEKRFIRLKRTLLRV